MDAFVFYLCMFVKLITGFAFIMAYLNISGRTQLSQMNSIDLIGNFILGGIIGGVIYTEQIPYYEYVLALLIGVITLMIVNLLCRKYYMLRSITIGNPIPIIRKGQFLMKNIIKKENKVDMLNIASQLNTQGIHSFDEIQYAQIEPNGTVTAICDENKLPSIIVCYKGKLRYDELENIKKNEKKFLADMKKQGISDIADIFFAEFKDGRFKYISNNGTVYPKSREAIKNDKAAGRIRKAAKSRQGQAH